MNTVANQQSTHNIQKQAFRRMTLRRCIVVTCARFNGKPLCNLLDMDLRQLRTLNRALADGAIQADSSVTYKLKRGIRALILKGGASC